MNRPATLPVNPVFPGIHSFDPHHYKIIQLKSDRSVIFRRGQNEYYNMQGILFYVNM